MARPGITYNQVADAAQTLASVGTNPTIGAVREALGSTGSPNTIHKHLTAWKEGNAQPVAKTAEFPARLIQALQDELSKATMLAREQGQVALLAAQSEAIELARSGEAIELERDSLAETVARITTQRDQWEVIEEELRKEIARLHDSVKVEQASAELGRIELAKAQLRIDADAIKLIEQAKDLQNMRQEINATIKERGEAYQSVAVMTARLEASERRSSEAQEREKSTTVKLERAENEIRQERAETIKNRVHIQSQQVALGVAARELETFRSKPNVKPQKAKPVEN